jgi:hypothetical protein
MYSFLRQMISDVPFISHFHIQSNPKLRNWGGGVGLGEEVGGWRWRQNKAIHSASLSGLPVLGISLFFLDFPFTGELLGSRTMSPTRFSATNSHCDSMVMRAGHRYLGERQRWIPLGRYLAATRSDFTVGPRCFPVLLKLFITLYASDSSYRQDKSFMLQPERVLLEPSESAGCLFSLSTGFCQLTPDLPRFILK